MSLFGGASSASLFGAQASSASPFGAPASGGGLFGSGTGAFKPPMTSASLFGSGSSLFGTTPQSASSLFGAAKPAAGGSLFGAPASSTSLFGAASSASLFGAAPQTQAGALFGGSLFSPQTAAPAQPPATPAVPGQSPYGALPAVTKLPEMRSGIATAPPSRAVSVPPPVLFRPKPRMTTPLRSPKASATPASTDLQRQLSKRSPSIFKVAYRDPGLIIQTPLPSTNASSSPPAAADAQPVSPAFVSPPARSSPGLQPAGPEIQPGLHRSSSPLNVTAPLSGIPVATPPSRIPAMTPTLNGLDGARDCTPSVPAAAVPAGSAARCAALPVLPEGWWVKPCMDDLALMAERNPSALQAVDRFTIGQSGVGSIMFLEDVDLSGIQDLSDAFLFEPGAVSAYYEGSKVPKPPPGQGVNQPARVQIELTSKQMSKIVDRNECRSTEEYVSQLKLRLKGLSATMDTTFVDLQVKGPKRCVWVFEVKHWSR
jgi:hypothetical protein